MSFKLSEKHFTYICYILESLIGTAIGYQLYKIYPSGGAWCLFSIILVLAPDRKDAMNLALARIKANFIGATIGLILFYFAPINFTLIAVGIVAAMSMCEWLKLQSATRSATIAVLIITLHEPGKHFWDVALERAIGVVAGCLIGVLLTYVFHLLVQKSKVLFHKIRP